MFGPSSLPTVDRRERSSAPTRAHARKVYAVAASRCVNTLACAFTHSYVAARVGDARKGIGIASALRVLITLIERCV